jgi:rod shape-determining protein MreC
MAVLEIRQRTGWLFAVVVIAHLILISAQARADGGVSVLSTLVFGVFAKIQQAASTGVSGVRQAWQDYFALRGIRSENESLQDEVARLKIALQEERTAAGQSRTLQGLLDLKRELPIVTTGARIIGGGASPDFRTMTIDKGTEDGVLADMAVIAPAGVVGRVVQPSASASKVQLLIDVNAGAGALVERSRVQGVIVGARDGLLRLEYVPGSADIAVGDRVVTSGVEGIFPSSVDSRYPKGFIIGHIESLEKRDGRYDNVVVRPSVDFTSLEAVLVVLTKPAGPSIDSAIERRRTDTAGNGAR